MPSHRVSLHPVIGPTPKTFAPVNAIGAVIATAHVGSAASAFFVEARHAGVGHVERHSGQLRRQLV